MAATVRSRAADAAEREAVRACEAAMRRAEDCEQAVKRAEAVLAAAREAWCCGGGAGGGGTEAQFVRAEADRERLLERAARDAAPAIDDRGYETLPARVPPPNAS